MSHSTQNKPLRTMLLALSLSIFFSLSSFNDKRNNKMPVRPNILFAILDDATYTHFGAYGCDWVKTPNFDRIAKNGLLFSKAYTPDAKCAPSRSSIVTGRNPWQLEAAANHWPHFPIKFKTYAEVLKENNYHVGFTGKGWGPGFAKNVKGERRTLIGKEYNELELTPPTTGISSTDYVANFAKFLGDKKDKEPFCFWLGSREPHRRYELGSGISKGGKKIEQIDRVYSFWPDRPEVRSDMLDYAYEIEYFDTQLGQILEILEKKGELANTLVVVTSDNGMPFPRIKSHEYELSNHMPLAIMWPGGVKSPGRVIDDYVTFNDFAPTFLEVAGIKASESGMEEITGHSLCKIFESDKSGQVDDTRNNFVLVGKERHDVGRPNDRGYPIRGIISGDYLFLKNYRPSRWPSGNPITGYLTCDGGPTKTKILNLGKQSQSIHYWNYSFGKRPEYELYNIKSDPECVRNLIDKPDFSDVSKQLNDKMTIELSSQKDPRILGNGSIFQTYEYSDSSSKNFYNRYISGEKVNFGWVNPTDFEDSDF